MYKDIIIEEIINTIKCTHKWLLPWIDKTKKILASPPIFYTSTNDESYLKNH